MEEQKKFHPEDPCLRIGNTVSWCPFLSKATHPLQETTSKFRLCRVASRCSPDPQPHFYARLGPTSPISGWIPVMCGRHGGFLRRCVGHEVVHPHVCRFRGHPDCIRQVVGGGCGVLAARCLTGQRWRLIAHFLRHTPSQVHGMTVASHRA